MTEYPQVGTHKTVRVAIKSRGIVLPIVYLRDLARRLPRRDSPTLPDASKKKEALLGISRRT